VLIIGDSLPSLTQSLGDCPEYCVRDRYGVVGYPSHIPPIRTNAQEEGAQRCDGGHTTFLPLMFGWGRGPYVSMGTMNSKHTYHCPLPDGTVITRTTARTYTHVLASFDGERWGWNGWCGRLDLAHTQRRREEGWWFKHYPEGRLAIIEIATGEIVWEHEGYIRATQPEPVQPAPVAQPAPVPSAPREPKPRKVFKNAGDIRSFVSIGLQPSIVACEGFDGALHRVATALSKDGVTERRVRNAIDGYEHLDELLALMTKINTPA
jgi:hypothetical protein